MYIQLQKFMKVAYREEISHFDSCTLSTYSYSYVFTHDCHRHVTSWRICHLIVFQYIDGLLEVDNVSGHNVSFLTSVKATRKICSIMTTNTIFDNLDIIANWSKLFLKFATLHMSHTFSWFSFVVFFWQI